jgi:hypothetical protein
MAAPAIKDTTLTQFVSNVQRAYWKKKPEDFVTPKRPLWKMFKDKGRIITEPTGFGPERTFITETPTNMIFMSQSDRIGTYAETPFDAKTTSQWDWIYGINSYTIDNYTKNNSRGEYALVNYIKEQMDQTAEGVRGVLENDLWYGRTKGSHTMWGLRQQLAFDPTLNPTTVGNPSVATTGQVGRVDRSNATYAIARNQATNFNAAYRTVEYGGQYTTMFDEGENSLLEQWWDCTNTGDGEAPDVIVGNRFFFRYCHRLASENKGTVYYDTAKTHELGVETFTFMGAPIIRDDKVPDDPNNSGYGVAMLLNTGTWEWVYANGLQGKWSEPVPVSSGQTAVRSDYEVQYTLICKHPRKNGIFYGVQNQSKNP